MNKEVTRYRRRRGYEHIGRPGRAEPGAATTGWRRRRIRLRLKPRLKLLLRLASAKKLFAWLRDAYVRMMVAFADSRLVGAGYGGGDAVIDRFGRGPLKEYDHRVIAEIYRSLAVAQGLPVASEAGNLSLTVAHRRW